MDKEKILYNKMDNLHRSMDVILEGIRSTLEPIGVDVEEEKKLKQKDIQWYLDNGWEETKCPHCKGYFLAKNWNTPSGCPRCHWSRVE